MNPAYIAPSAYRLANGLLDQIYDEVKDEVDALIAEEEHLGVTFDETTNIISDRVLNVTLTTKFGAFYYHNAILPPETASAELIIEAVLETVDVVCKGKRE